MYRLSAALRDKDDRLLRDFKKEAQEILDQLASEVKDLRDLPRWDPEVVSQLLELQELIDVAPESEVAKQAKKQIVEIYKLRKARRSSRNSR